MNHLSAKVSCFARAYHNRTARYPIFRDEAAEQLLGRDYETIAQSLMQGISYFMPGFQGSPEEGLRQITDRQLSPSVLGRSVFCETMLEEQNGMEQVLILATGYDTFGIRNQDPSLTVYEADLPDVMDERQKRIREAGLSSRSVSVACDLRQKNWLSVLQESGFDRERKTFVSMLGISYYLEPEEFRRLMHQLGSLLAEGSCICFDYPEAKEGREAAVNRQLAFAANEPMKASYSGAKIQRLLEQNCFEIRKHLSPEEMTEQYFSGYNSAEPEHRIIAPEGVCYVFAGCTGK